MNQASDLHVAVISNANPQVLTVLALGPDYTIQTPSIQIGNAQGGNIVLNPTGFLAATGGNLPNGWTLVIRRAVVLGQPAILGNQESFDPSSVENMVDYMSMQILQLQDTQARCVQVPTDDVALTQNLGLALSRANLFLAFDANGMPIAAANILTGIAATQYSALIIGAPDKVTTLGILGLDFGCTTATLAAGVYTLATGKNVGAAGSAIAMIPGTTNPGAASLKCTFNAGSVTAPIHTKAGNALAGGELVQGSVYLLAFDGANWRIIA